MTAGFTVTETDDKRLYTCVACGAVLEQNLPPLRAMLDETALRILREHRALCPCILLPPGGRSG